MITINIRTVMKRKKLSIYQLATRADISINTARAWYFGVATRIDLPILDRVCRALEVDPSEVLIQTAEEPLGSEEEDKERLALVA